MSMLPLRRSRFVAPVLACALLLVPAAHPVVAAAGQPAYITVSQGNTPVAPGITLSSFERLYPTGWVQGYLLTSNLANPSLEADLLFAGAVTAAKPLSQMAAGAGAIAAVNADFFDINNTKMPLGPAIHDGTMIKTGPPGWNAAGVGVDRIGRLTAVAMEGSITLPGGIRHPLATLNQYSVPEQSIGLYTELWTASRVPGAAFGAQNVREVTVKGGRVTKVATAVGTERIEPGTFVLVGREAGADKLASLKVGDPVEIAYAPKDQLRFAVGGGAVLIRNGQMQELDDRQYKPRSAMGFTADGKTMFLAAIDGRSEESGGMTLRQLADYMRSLGAHNALELDGGGSTTIVARRPGETAPVVWNRPSDGEERRVPNGIGLWATPGSGKLSGLTLAPANSAPNANRTFPYLRRTLVARGYDEAYGPAAAVDGLTWQVTTPGAGLVSSKGTVQARRPGTLTVQARSGEAVGAYTLEVLGSLDRVEANVQGLRLAGTQRGSFRITGFDAAGFSAPIGPADMTLLYDRTALTVAPDNQGGLQVTALKDGQFRITVDVFGRQAVIPVASGVSSMPVARFESVSPWTFQQYPDTVKGALSSAPGRTGNGLKLTYDFAGSTATRAAYADAAPALVLPGQPQKLGLWVHGDGKGAWLRAVTTDAAGTSYTLTFASQVDWTGWRQVEAEVPAQVKYPLQLSRIYAVEANKDRQYAGELILDELTAITPTPLITVPRPLTQPSPLLTKGLPEGAIRFGYLAAPGALPQAMAAQPAFLLSPAPVQAPVPVRTPGKPFSQGDTRFHWFTGTSFANLVQFKAELDETAASATTRNAVIIGQPLPQTKEGRLIETWLTELWKAGKRVAYVAPSAEAATVRWFDGVAYVNLGDSVVLGLTSGENWLQVQTR